MTNAEKFKEVFGFKPDTTACIAPDKVCQDHMSRILNSGEDVGADECCDTCPFGGWFNKEFKECFKLSDKFED